MCMRIHTHPLSNLVITLPDCIIIIIFVHRQFPYCFAPCIYMILASVLILAECNYSVPVLNSIITFTRTHVPRLVYLSHLQVTFANNGYGQASMGNKQPKEEAKPAAARPSSAIESIGAMEKTQNLLTKRQCLFMHSSQHCLYLNPYVFLYPGEICSKKDAMVLRKQQGLK